MSRRKKIITGAVALGVVVGGGVTALVYQDEILKRLGLTLGQKEYLGEQLESMPSTGEAESGNTIEDVFGLGEEPTLANDGSYETHIENGRYYLQNGFLDFAAQEFAAAAEISTEGGESLALLGQAQYMAKDYLHAAENLEMARSKGDSSVVTGVLWTRALLNQEKFEEAEVAFREVDTGSEEEDILYLRGLLGILENNREVAGGSLTHLTELYPESAYAPQVKKYLEAYYEFDLYQDGKPEHLRTLLARALNQNGEYALAAELLRQVLLTAANYRDAWVLLGYAYYAQEDYLQAQNAWQKAAEIDPTHPETQYFLGLSYASLDEYPAAIDAFKAALENNFTPAEQVLAKMGEVYMAMQDYQAAAETYEKYLENDGKQVLDNFVRPIWIYLEYLGEDGKKKGLALAEEAVDLFPQQAMAYNLLGWAEVYNEDYDAAKVALDKALQLDPDLAAVYLNFGKLYEALGNTDAALESYRVAYEKGMGTSIGNLAAKAYNSLLSLQ